jgi:hypothetical protein
LSGKTQVERQEMTLTHCRMGAAERKGGSVLGDSSLEGKGAYAVLLGSPEDVFVDEAVVAKEGKLLRGGTREGSAS